MFVMYMIALQKGYIDKMYSMPPSQPSNQQVRHAHYDREKNMLGRNCIFLLPSPFILMSSSHAVTPPHQIDVPAFSATQFPSSVAPSCSSSHRVVRKVSRSTSSRLLLLFSPFIARSVSGLSVPPYVMR